MSLEENQFEVNLNEDQQLIANIFMYNGVLQLLSFLEELPEGNISKERLLEEVDEWIKENYG